MNGWIHMLLASSLASIYIFHFFFFSSFSCLRSSFPCYIQSMQKKWTVDVRQEAASMLRNLACFLLLDRAACPISSTISWCNHLLDIKTEQRQHRAWHADKIKHDPFLSYTDIGGQRFPTIGYDTSSYLYLRISATA